jgi:hypothetical protein
VDADLAPGRTTTIDVPVDHGPFWTVAPTSITLEFDDGTSMTVGGDVGVNPVVKRTHEIDGELGEVEGLPGVRLPGDGRVHLDSYGGPADLSGDVWLTWDDEHLTLSARITDDEHTTGWPLWKHDSIQLGVTTGPPTERRSFSELNVAMTPNGPRVFNKTQPSGPDASPIDDAEVVVERRNGRTVYEAAIPWSAIHASPDGPVSASLLINDNDGEGREGYVEWASGIGSGKNTNQFQSLQLLETVPAPPATASPATTATTASRGEPAAGPDHGDTVTEPTPGQSPGVGALAGLVALLLGLAGVARRR